MLKCNRGRICATWVCAVVFIVSLWFASSATRGDIPCGDLVINGSGGTGEPSGPYVAGSDPTGCQSTSSSCWFSGLEWVGDWPWPDTGFALNVELWSAVAPMDSPPVSLDPYESTSPLVSREVRHSVGPAPYRERQTLNGAVDLLTGAPLLREMDFELPFGGATFRHIRTYSENLSFEALRPSWGIFKPPWRGTFWDWNGMFWMMGENPLFLIDLEYHDTVFGQDFTAGDECRCYFIPDAHHAIPFSYLPDSGDTVEVEVEGGTQMQRVPGTGRYEAPPWFDAVMTSSQYEADDGVDDLGRPKRFYVWLNRKTVKYTIRAHYEDLWDENGFSVHLPSEQGGFGLPYYGLVTEIADRYGNKIEIEYCDDRRFAWDDYGYTDPGDQTSDCIECGQNCTEKGQIRSVRLLSAADEVVWTLVYTHRAFSSPFSFFDFAYPSDDPASPFGQHALHSIHVYEGDVNLSALEGCLTLASSEFCDAISIAEMEAIDHSVIAGLGTWSIEVKYTYGNGNECTNEDQLRLFKYAGATWTPEADPDETLDKELKYRLLKTKVTRRDASPSTAETESDVSTTLYRYGEATNGHNEIGNLCMNGERALKAVYDNSTINSILAATEDPEMGPDFLFELMDCTPVEYVVDPVGGITETKSLGELASLRMIQFSLGSEKCNNPELSVPSLQTQGDNKQAMVEFYGGDLTKTFFFEGGRRFLCDNRQGGTSNGRFMLYIFLELNAEDLDLSGCEGMAESNTARVSCGQLVYRHPMRFRHPGCDQDPGWNHDLRVPAIDRRFFIAVIDEIDVPPGSGNYNPGSRAGIVKRRVVEMNPAGFVLRDRTWDKDDLDGDSTSQEGTEETCVYDSAGRMVERRSKGWDSPANAGTRETEGLIHVFDYFDEASNAPGELKAIGVKKGTGSEGTESIVQYVAAFEREVEGRPDLVTKEVQYASPTAEPSPTSQPAGIVMEVTEYGYTLGTPAESEAMTEFSTAPIIAKKVIRPAVRWSSDVDMSYHAVQFTEYDDNGNLVWLGAGSLEEPSDPASAKEFFVNYSGYDDLGRPTVIVEDADLDGEASPPSELPTEWPDNWARVSPDGGYGMNLTTRHGYDPVYGRVRTQFPNGRWQFIGYVKQGGGDVDQWTFNDVLCEWDDDTEMCIGNFEVQSPTQIKHFSGGRLVKDKRVILTATDNSPDGQGTEETNYEVLSVSTPTYDSSGRISGLERVGQESGSSLSASVLYHGYGGIARQRDTDGTITRNVYDGLGRLYRVYRGTNDEHEYWGYGVECSGEQTPEDDDCYYGDDCPDNMALLEKYYYGNGDTDGDSSVVGSNGINDFGQLVKVRNYRDLPLNQYFIVDPAPECQGEPPLPSHCPPDNNENDIGWVVEIQYDWRMRSVWEQGQNADCIALNHTFTWYDNLDRVRFVASYGASAPTDPDIDPRLLDADCVIPDAAAILGASPPPLSLTESVYNARGQEAETRSYLVSSASGPEATASRQYYDHRNQPVEVHSPNSPVMRNFYDAKGRQIRSSSYVQVPDADDIEISRTDTVFDTNDRAIETTYWERRHDATETVLTDANSVKTFTQSWYDPTGRVIATANFGTNNTDNNEFSTGLLPAAYNELFPPVIREVPDDPESQVIGCCWTDSSYAGALLTCYAYDDEGHQAAVFHPDQTVSRTEYDDLDRVVLETENADDLDTDLVRRKAYMHDAETGQLIKMAAILPDHVGANFSYEDINWSATDGTIQVTEFIYTDADGLGADVVDSSLTQISSNKSFIKEARFPDKVNGQPSAVDAIQFEYYSNGSVARRTDAKGSVFTHTYDELGQRIETVIDDSAWFTLDSPQGNIAPPNRIHRLAYEYWEDGSLNLVTAYTTRSDGTEDVLAQNQFFFNERGNLGAEFQQHNGLVDTANTPRTSYLWTMSPFEEHNFERLFAIWYPHKQPDDGNPISVQFHYGNDTNDIDSAVGRITAIQHIREGTVATYDYAGTYRRIAMTHGNGITQTVDDGGSYTGLDRFGRMKDLHYKDASDNTVHRYQYGYDKAGNRTFARVQQATHEEVTHDNDRSYLYGYDALRRLISADMGKLNGDNTAIDTGGSAPIPRSIEWQLDNLGNWAAGDSNDSVVYSGDLDLDGVADLDRNIHHNVNNANMIGSLYTDGVETSFIHDICGNLVYDGKRFYQYDAWNRLIQVNLLGYAELDPSDGRITHLNENMGVDEDGNPIGGLGDLVCRYSYDGLGRLILKETPVNVGSTYLQRKDYYYDGVRRIEEVIFRPAAIVTPLDPPPASQPADPPDTGDTDPLDPGNTTFVTGGDVANDELVMVRQDGINPLQQILDPINVTPIELGETWVDREYVYGPDYVDEFILQIDRKDGGAIYMLQDANYNVVALMTGEGIPDGQGGTLPAGQMLEQYTYEPYGEIVASESFAPHAVNRVGHQGLFFERFDGSYTKKSLRGGASGNQSGDEGGFYYNRNRFYDPQLGRFIQRDPNETGLPIISALAMNGDALSILLGGFSGQSLYSGGMNLYQYVNSNPVNHRDSLGLYDDFDAFFDDMAGSRIYTIGLLNEGARMASIGATMALDIAGSILGIDIFQSVMVLAEGKGGFWDAMNIVASVTPIGKVANIIGKGVKIARRGRSAGKVIGTALDQIFKILPFGKAQKLTKGHGNQIQAHKLFEWRHLKKDGLVKKADVPAVILPKGMHTELTTILQRRLPKNESHSPAKIWRVYQEVYRDTLGHPEWLDPIRKYFQ